VVAAISHLPQVVASVLMATVAGAADDAALAAAAGGLRDSTRIAENSARMWQPIFAANADVLMPLARPPIGCTQWRRTWPTRTRSTRSSPPPTPGAGGCRHYNRRHAKGRPRRG
jgi:hypothetical protein